MLVTFGPQVWSDFLTIPALYANIPDLYSNICPPSSTVGFLHLWHWRARAQCKNEGGGRGSHGWQNIACRYARKIIMARNILRQP